DLRSVRLSRFARFDHFASLRSHIFDCRRDFAGFLPSRNAGGCFAKNTDVRRTRGLSTSHRGSLLASSALAKRTSRSQAIARCDDKSGATGNESKRLSAQLTGAGGLLATANYGRAVTGRDGSHGTAHQAAGSPAGTL